MRSLALAVFGLVFFAGCTKANGPAPAPIQAVGCTVETAVSSSIAGAVSTALQCANTAQVAADLQAMWGNINLCSQTAAQVSQLKAQMKPQGVIASVVCPIAIQSAVAFLSNSVPAAWKCTGPNATMSGLITVLTTACEAAPF